ncbi:MAG: hypothetical protein K0R12_699 [Gammaproteobacteria bacterium]|jgi:cell division protein ZapA|nr:hypothetical protein [Gammaproteobacteria bacterium]
MSDQDTMSVDILGRHFKIKCPQDKIPELQEAAALLDESMRTVRQSGVSGPDRIAIMAALNIAHELLLLREQKDKQINSMGERLHKLQQRIDQALSLNGQTEFE